jgi:hypothetical protein
VRSEKKLPRAHSTNEQRHQNKQSSGQSDSAEQQRAHNAKPRHDSGCDCWFAKASIAPTGKPLREQLALAVASIDKLSEDRKRSRNQIPSTEHHER